MATKKTVKMNAMAQAKRSAYKPAAKKPAAKKPAAKKPAAKKPAKGVASLKFDRTIEIYPRGNFFGWRSVAKNGRVTAVSYDGFSKMGNAERAATKEVAAWQGKTRIVRAEA